MATKLQNEANPNPPPPLDPKKINHSRPKAESILFSPLHCSGDLLIQKNEKRTQSHHQRLLAYIAQRVTGHGSRVTINEKRTQSTKSYVPEGTKTNPITIPQIENWKQKITNLSRFYSQKVSLSHQLFNAFAHFLVKKRALFVVFSTFGN